jgi:hypothetical protein
MDGPHLLVHIRPSPRLRAVLLAGSAAALAAPWLSALDPGAALLLDGLVLLVACGARAWLLPSPPLLLRRDARGWALGEAAAQEPVELLPDSTVWPLLTVLRIASVEGVRTLVLLPDSAAPAELRRLRAALRLQAPPSGHQDRVDGPV